MATGIRLVGRATSLVGRPVAGRYSGPMGFNPHRQYRRSTADYVLVAVALVICAALVAWAFLG